MNDRKNRAKYRYDKIFYVFYSLFWIYKFEYFVNYIYVLIQILTLKNINTKNNC